MNAFGLWKIAAAGPARLQNTGLRLERDLETWIEADPALLELGLVIVARQLRLEAGPLDLLALDPQGRWVLIEIKRERLRREVVAQGIDYASCVQSVDMSWLRDQCDSYLKSRAATATLAELLDQRGRPLGGDAERREVVIYLVGTSLDPGLERMIGFLAERGDLSLRIVTFSAFQDPSGQILLAREIHEEDAKPEAGLQKPVAAQQDLEAVLNLADRSGVGEVVRTLNATAQELGFVARPHSKSVMFAPPANRTRCLLVVWVDRRHREPGSAKAYVASEAFEQFYGITANDLEAAVGPINRYITLDRAGAEHIREGLRKLMGGLLRP